MNRLEIILKTSLYYSTNLHLKNVQSKVNKKIGPLRKLQNILTSIRETLKKKSTKNYVLNISNKDVVTKTFGAHLK